MLFRVEGRVDFEVEVTADSEGEANELVEKCLTLASYRPDVVVTYQDTQIDDTEGIG